MTATTPAVAPPGQAVVAPRGRRRRALLLLVLPGAALATGLALLPGPEAPPAAAVPGAEPVRPVGPAVPVEQGSAVGGPGTPASDGRTVAVRAGGRDRGYLLLPAIGLPPGTPAPLLVVLHQDIASPRAVAVELGLDALRRDGITLAYPAGFGGSWAAGACCGHAAAQGVDDVAFVDAVLRDAGRHTPIDAERTAVLGYSGGGMLLYKFLCRPHTPVVAAVEVNGSLESHCSAGLRLPDLLSLHGSRDGSVGLHRPVYVTHLKMAPRPVTSTLRIVTERAACTGREAVPGPDVDLVRFTGCRGGGSVEAVLVKAAGHRWEDVDGAGRARAWLVPRLTDRLPGQRSDA